MVFDIGIVYHLIFPFRRLIALDLDLKFTVDVAELADQFELMAPENILAAANDLAPHYWYDFRHYRRRHPETIVGQVRPGLQVRFRYIFFVHSFFNCCLVAFTGTKHWRAATGPAANAAESTLWQLLGERGADSSTVRKIRIQRDFGVPGPVYTHRRWASGTHLHPGLCLE